MSPQRQIAHYRIVSKLGEGGMGAVYRATDTKLNREVAIKMLPAAFAQDAARMERFAREAQILASLNHPNIAAIYGIEVGAIVMELVEGEDLKGPVPVETAIAYAKQIVAGLDAAHEKGIVHRDLKPANIKVTPNGTVKLLDFGLAKSPAQGDEPAGTMTISMTQAGAILGTAAYMAPEQARGKPVDKRADIWAFGVVLYEILTGDLLFGGGETVADTLASVMKDAPDLKKLPPETPARLRRLIGLCLRKDPAARLRDIGDARVILDEEDVVPAAVAAKPSRWPLWAACGAAAAMAAIAAIAWLRPAPVEKKDPAVHFLVPFPPDTGFPSSSSATEWVPSPDGNHLAMVVREKDQDVLWVRPLNSTTAHRLDKTEGAAFPFWSPDSQHIAFFTMDKLKRIPVAGGAVQTVCELKTGTSTGSVDDGGAWSKDGFIVFANNREPLKRVPASGGIPTLLFPAETPPAAQAWPQFLPDGRHLLYLLRSTDTQARGIFVQEIGASKPVLLLKNEGRAVWSQGYLLFVHEGALFAQRMNPSTLRLEGEPLTIADEVQNNPGAGRSSFAVSENGILVYRTGSSAGAANRQLYWRDREGKTIQAVGNPGSIRHLTISPDGKSAALTIGAVSTPDVWLMNLETGVITPLTHGGDVAISTGFPWSPDSKRLAISPRAGGVEEIAVDSGKITVLTKEPVFVEDYTVDGNAVLCRDIGGRDLSLVPARENSRPQVVFTDGFRKGMIHFSPDGKYVAYTSFETGSQEVYVASFPSFSVKRRLSSAAGVYPVWGRTGKEVFYRALDGPVTSVPVALGARIEVGTPKPLFQTGAGRLGNAFAISADGQRFLTAEPVTLTPSETVRFELNVVVNWAAALQR